MSPNMNQRTHSSFRGFASNAFAKQRGSALVIGIFVITVMFLMASALINVLEDADEQVNLEVWGTRALAAANSGADSALAQLFPLDGSASSCTNVSATWTPPVAPGFHQCSVVLTCTPTTVASVTRFLITSAATCETGDCSSINGNCLRVNRQVEVEARD
ncbi:MSHA biogenesis protein MshP [Shewanella benthica]|uniref:MSHA biogenesis protein MshP n=1 Tax=Shewanella benthica TaxID=43661 RepID=UPI00187AAED1|nr:MSHA biogenesis protein MshP [Shewanella benthica]MBE7214453.1 MSHA biogenesis protein MshP [Shewanella benthica]MCL1061519.1 MSHA biogenesis protein MshP [Shewanella benthica]